MNCQVVRVFANKKLQTCTVENSSEINLMLNHLTKNCKVFTTCARSMWIQTPKDGVDDTDYDLELWHRNAVAEMYETKINGGMIETIPSEALE